MWFKVILNVIISNGFIQVRDGTLTGTTTGGARGVMVIVAGCGHDNTSSNPGRAWLHFT